LTQKSDAGDLKLTKLSYLYSLINDASKYISNGSEKYDIENTSTYTIF